MSSDVFEADSGEARVADTTIPGLKSFGEKDLCFLLLWDLKDPKMSNTGLTVQSQELVSQKKIKVSIMYVKQWQAIAT